MSRKFSINLSAKLERAVTEDLAAEQSKKWREDNREAIEAYNRHVEEHGAFSDELRKF